MKKITYLKSLLLAAGLCVGASAWADYVNVGTVDFESESTYTANWTSNAENYHTTYWGSRTVGSTTSHYYGEKSTGNTRNMTYTIPFTSFTSATQWKMEFYGAMYSSNGSNTILRLKGSSNIFTLSLPKNTATVNILDGLGTEVGTLTQDAYSTSTRDNLNGFTNWLHFTVTADKEENGVWVVIENADGTTALTSTKVCDFVNATAIYFETGSQQSRVAVDDLSFYIWSDTEVITDPSVSITGVSGNDRIITVIGGTSSLGNSVTTYYTTDGSEPTSSSSVYLNPITITEDCTVKVKTISNAGGESTVQSLVIKTGAVKLAAPSVALASYTSFTESNLTGPKFTITEPNNSDVLCKPGTETLEYTFTPDGGIESARTSITSGYVYTPTAYGTLTVYANTTGYTESSYSVSVSSVYSVATTYDYTQWSAEEAVALGWTSASGWDNEAAYKIPSSGIYNHLYILNDNTIDYVVGYGIGRQNNPYSNFAIRNVYKGDIYHVVTSTVAAEPVKSDVILFAKAGTGADGDGVSIPSVATKNVVKIAYRLIPVSLPISATITSDAGYATYYTPYALDFSEVENLKAYTAKVSGNKVTLTQVDNVPAETGVILKGDADTYNIPVIASSATAKGDLKGSASAVTESETDGNAIYVLNKVDENVGFYKLDGTLDAGKAYLDIPAVSGARMLTFVIEGETTAIANVKSVAADNGCYNLNGQRVAAPQKGLYIVNGKKVIVK